MSLNKRNYPFHESMKKSLPKIDSLPSAIRLMRLLMTALDTSPLETELLVLLASHDNAVSSSEACEALSYYPKIGVEYSLTNLAKKGMIAEQYSELGKEKIYSSVNSVCACIKLVTQPIVNTVIYSDYQVPTSDGVVKKGGFFQRMGRRFDTLFGLRKTVTYDVTPELEEALEFAFTLLAPGQNIEALLESNPEMAKRAHKAIYERFARDEPYMVKMHRLSVYPKPFTLQ